MLWVLGTAGGVTRMRSMRGSCWCRVAIAVAGARELARAGDRFSQSPTVALLRTIGGAIGCDRELIFADRSLPHFELVL